MSGALLPTSSRRAVAGVLLAMAWPAAMRGQTPAGAPRLPPAPFDVPGWAFPLPASTAPPPTFDSVTPRRVHGSTGSFTETQAQNRFSPADWYPSSHGAMPDIVARGRKPVVLACAFCHLPDGIGRPENAMLAGLSAAYMAQQLADIRSRTRMIAWRGPHRPTDAMRDVADSMTSAEEGEALRYFSQLRPRRRSRVRETTEIPRVIPSMGLYVKATDGGVEPLGRRLIEIAEDKARHELHDARASYVAYVPPGSIARGRVLGTAIGARACATCHGPQLKGMGAAPPIAGRSPSYLLRQLLAFRTGARSAPASAPMRDVAAMLTMDDMIAAAAYVGSRAP